MKCRTVPYEYPWAHDFTRNAASPAYSRHYLSRHHLSRHHHRHHHRHHRHRHRHDCAQVVEEHETAVGRGLPPQLVSEPRAWLAELGQRLEAARQAEAARRAEEQVGARAGCVGWRGAVGGRVCTGGRPEAVP